MLPGKKYKPEDILQMAWRRKWAVIVPFVVIFTATVVVSLLLPDRYRSEAVILVVPQSVPENYVKAAVTERIDDRLRSISTEILSRTRLEAIIRERGLYPVERQRLPMEDVVEVMRKDITISVDLAKGDAFRVAYSSGDPRTSQQVTEQLAGQFTNEHEQNRITLASATLRFLQTQLDDARRRLVDQEDKIAEFQRKHAGGLPSERDSNLQAMHNLQLQIQALLDSMNRDRDRRLFLERTLADLESEQQGARGMVQAVPGGGSPDQLQAGATNAERLEALRNSLKSMELNLKPEHPDVVYVKRLIQDLEAKVKAEAANPQSAASTAPARPRTSEEAVALRRIQEIRQELAAVDIQLASKAADEKRLREQVAVFERRIAATPALEAEFTALARDYETTRKVYDSLLAKQEDSKVATAMEQNQIGENFKLIDPARLPEAPYSPNRWLINLFGAFGGLAVGLGLVSLLHYKDKSLESEDDVLIVLRLPVLAAIPVIETADDRRRAKRRRVLGIVGAVTTVVLLAVGVAVAWSFGLIRIPLMFK